jgi:ribonuclease P protein component
MYTFGKQERLCSKITIDALFLSGHRLMLFPYSVHWMLCPTGTLPDGVPAQVLIATSKKKFHHAVDRNRVKRLTRECYRLHKPALYQFLTTQNINLILSINYIHTSILDFHTLNHKFDKITDVLIEKIGHLQSNPEA